MAPPPPRRCLDLGCGIGSVLLMVAWQFPHARVVGVEAQRRSAAMARRSIAYNVPLDIDDASADAADGRSAGATSEARRRRRCEVWRGDLRALRMRPPRPPVPPEAASAAAGSAGDSGGDADDDTSSPCGPFDLITGTPPYFGVALHAAGERAADGEDGGVKPRVLHACMGSLPSSEQAAPARYELRGGCEEYVAAVARLLHRGGAGGSGGGSGGARAVVCAGGARHAERVLGAAHAERLEVVRHLEVRRGAAWCGLA